MASAATTQPIHHVRRLPDPARGWRLRSSRRWTRCRYPYRITPSASGCPGGVAPNMGLVIRAHVRHALGASSCVALLNVGGQENLPNPMPPAVFRSHGTWRPRWRPGRPPVNLTPCDSLPWTGSTGHNRLKPSWPPVSTLAGLGNSTLRPNPSKCPLLLYHDWTASATHGRGRPSVFRPCLPLWTRTEYRPCTFIWPRPDR